MTAGRCASCKFWKDGAILVRGAHYCSAMILIGHEKNVKARVVGTELEAELITEPDFGCVLWEAQEPMLATPTRTP